MVSSITLGFEYLGNTILDFSKIYTILEVNIWIWKFPLKQGGCSLNEELLKVFFKSLYVYRACLCIVRGFEISYCANLQDDNSLCDWIA